MHPQRGEQGRPPSINDIFKMDLNGDGKLTKLEVSGPILQDFDKIDVNKDGFITRAELGEMPRPKRPPVVTEDQEDRLQIDKNVIFVSKKKYANFRCKYLLLNLLSKLEFLNFMHHSRL